MTNTNPKEASVSLDESDRRVKMIFEHLPRVGDFIAHDNKMYEVDRVVFNGTDSSEGVFGYPNVYCRPSS